MHLAVINWGGLCAPNQRGSPLLDSSAVHPVQQMREKWTHVCRATKKPNLLRKLCLFLHWRIRPSVPLQIHNLPRSYYSTVYHKVHFFRLEAIQFYQLQIPWSRLNRRFRLATVPLIASLHRPMYKGISCAVFSSFYFSCRLATTTNRQKEIWRHSPIDSLPSSLPSFFWKNKVILK